MCGIIAVVRSDSTRAVPNPDDISELLSSAAQLLADAEPDQQVLVAAANSLDEVNGLLSGLAGVQCLIATPALVSEITQQAAVVDAELRRLESELDEGRIDGTELEALNAAVIRLKDANWSIHRDRLRTAAAVVDLCGTDAGAAQVATMLSVQEALSALDRLAVRGRDSAGLHLLVRTHGLRPDDRALVAALAERDDPLFGHRSVHQVDGLLSFVYKAAAEIGELGDNTAVLRSAIGSDHLLARVLSHPDARTVVLGHTRWASVG
ncbi:MAG: SIS domain-containing protein, partial [Acidimicrobiales bacterium]